MGDQQVEVRTSIAAAGRPPHVSPDWRDWYQLQVWRRRRLLHLKLEPMCRFCLKQGKPTPATIADHIEPHHGDWNKFRLGTLQSLCKPCHESTKKQLQSRGYHNAIGEDGFPLDPNHPVYGSASRQQSTAKPAASDDDD